MGPGHRHGQAAQDEHGCTPRDIADRMNKTLAGRDLFSDHPLDDERLVATAARRDKLPIPLTIRFPLAKVSGICASPFFSKASEPTSA